MRTPMPTWEEGTRWRIARAKEERDYWAAKIKALEDERKALEGDLKALEDMLQSCWKCGGPLLRYQDGDRCNACISNMAGGLV